METVCSRILAIVVQILLYGGKKLFGIKLFVIQHICRLMFDQGVYLVITCVIKIIVVCGREHDHKQCSQRQYIGCAVQHHVSGIVKPLYNDKQQHIPEKRIKKYRAVILKTLQGREECENDITHRFKIVDSIYKTVQYDKKEEQIGNIPEYF